jgi:hypothetical protein
MSDTKSPRIVERPNVRDWGMDELMTVAEAVQLHWPNGPLKVATLRTAVRKGELPVCVVAGKFFLTRRGLLSLSQGKTLTDRKSTVAGVGLTKEASSSVRMSREEALRWVGKGI